MEKTQKLQQWIDESRRIVFFGGAGVSTESGIPDFRSPDGLYHTQFDAPPEEILSHSFFLRHPETFYRFYREKMLYPNAQPGPAHKKLALLEDAGKLCAIVTQNIDGLHQKAGSRRVLELHGSVLRNFCMECGAFYSALPEGPDLPRCSCGGLIKPDVVLYEEALDDGVLDAAIREISEADLLLIGGTSLGVYPAAGLIRYFKGSRMVLLNRSKTPYDHLASLIFRESIGSVLGEIRV